jgi:outer membrane protein assembly factor BamB
MRTHDNRRDSLGIMFYQFRLYGGGERVDRSETPYDSNPTISDSLFATDTETWQRKWTYHSGRILNTSYVVHGDRAFFAECRSEEVVNHPTGRINLLDFFASDAYLVALDLQTGKKLWEVPLEDTRTNHCFYLAAWKDIVFYLNSYFLEDMTCVFSSRAYDVSDGSERWRSEVSTEKKFPYRWTGNDSGHNQTWQIPVVVGGKAYINFPMNAKTGVIDLKTGRDESTREVWNNRCTPFSASATNLYFRAGYTSTYDVTLGENAPVTRVTRPSCWISILPAGGLLQMPEGQSINCRCGYPIRTSVVMVPRTVSDP